MAIRVVAAANQGNGIGASAEAAHYFEENVKGWLQMQVPIYPAVDFERTIAIGSANEEEAAFLQVTCGSTQHFLRL